MIFEPSIRAVMRQHSDGLTLIEIAQHAGVPYRAVHRTVTSMPDVYIDRWLQPKGVHRYQSVWCIVIPPENCPHPREGNK